MRYLFLIGIPGVGKTTLATKLLGSIESCQYLQRDYVRTFFLNNFKEAGKEGLPSEEFDKLLSYWCGSILVNMARPEGAAIYDACNTNIKDLYFIVNEIKREVAPKMKLRFSFIFIGTPDSPSKVKTTEVVEQDYSGYIKDEAGALTPNHVSIPSIVMNKKREELRELIDAFSLISYSWLEEISHDVFFLPECPTDVILREKKLI